MKKIISFLLAGFLVFPCVLTGCTQSGDASDSTQNENNQSQNIEPLSFEKTNVNLVENGVSNYQIVVSAKATAEQRYPAEELQYFLEQSTGCKLQIVSDAGLTAGEDKCYLSVGHTTLLESQTDIVLDKEFYGDTGVSIDTIGKSVYMTGAADLGTLYSVYKFLSYQIDFTAYTLDFIKFDYYKTLPLLDFDYHYAPSIEHFFTSEFEMRESDTRAPLRMFALGPGGYKGAASIYGRLFDEWSHTCAILVNPDFYKEEHPEWFQGDQFCFSNDEFADQMAENIIQNYTKNEHPYIMIGGADTVGACPCENCKKMGMIYGGHPGLLVRFMNKLAAKIEKHFIENNIDKEYTLVGLIYHSYMTAPTTKDENGNVIPIHEESVPDSEGLVQVGVCYAPISACWTHTLMDPTCEINLSFGENLKNWAFLTDNIMTYTYGGNFSTGTLFCNSWSTYEEQVKDFVDAGIKFWFEEARGWQASIFGEMRTYIKCRLAWNHTLDVEELIDEFIEAYYGVAAEDMKTYFDALRDQSEIIHRIQGVDCQGTYYELKKTENFPHEELLNHARLLKSAMYKIRQSDYSEEDKAIYEENIYREYLLVKINEYLLYRTDLTPTELAELEEIVTYANSILINGSILQ